MALYMPVCAHVCICLFFLFRAVFHSLTFTFALVAICHHTSSNCKMKMNQNEIIVLQGHHQPMIEKKYRIWMYDKNWCKILHALNFINAKGVIITRESGKEKKHVNGTRLPCIFSQVGRLEFKLLVLDTSLCN